MRGVPSTMLTQQLQTQIDVPFNRPVLRGKELSYIRQVLDSGQLAAGGRFSERVESILESSLPAPRALLTHSCTGALEIAAALCIDDGDEVILPSFAYPTTASAFARRGAKLVFVDILPNTLNIDPSRILEAISERTRAVVGIHYAGVAFDVDAVRQIARTAGIAFIEDAAHGVGAKYRNRSLGVFGDLATFSFHETKNVTSGEGGALIINEATLIERAEIIRDRGTNRRDFKAGHVDAYEWVDLGSAYAPPEIVAAFLLAQIEDVEIITRRRVAVWQRYHDAFANAEREGCLTRMAIPPEVAHNGHIFFVLLRDPSQRPRVLAHLRNAGINATSHFVPLHGSQAGIRYGRPCGSLAATESAAARLLRLPMHESLSVADQDRVIEAVFEALAAR